jgi:hypothetical protein
MAVEQAIVFFALFAYYLLRFLRDEQAQSALDDMPAASLTRHS